MYIQGSYRRVVACKIALVQYHNKISNQEKFASTIKPLKFLTFNSIWTRYTATSFVALYGQPAENTQLKEKRKQEWKKSDSKKNTPLFLFRS